MKQLKYQITLIVFLLLIAILPNYSKATNISVDKVEKIKYNQITTNSITLTWKNVKKATAYQVFMYNDSTGEYDYFKTSDTNSITLKKLKSAKRYKIKIRAYRRVNGKKYHGPRSNMFKFFTKPDQTKNIVMKSQTTNTIQLSWNKVSRIDGYKIYTRTNSNNSWTYYGKVKTNSIELKKLLSSQIYEIRVRAYRTNNGVQDFVAYSSVIQAFTRPAQVTNLRMKENNSKTITIMWNGVPRATKYKVYRYNEDKKSWDYCGKTKNWYYEYEKPKKETHYKFRVRAYLSFNDTQQFGAYSNVFSTKAGMDVSHHNGNIDWQKIKKAGIEFVIIKAGGRGYGNGKIYEDSEFKTNIEQATKMGLEVGIYFYSASKNEKEAVEEAKWCVDILKKYKMENKCKYIAYDFEEYKEHRTSDMTRKELNKVHFAFLKEINKTKYVPILYANKNYLTNYLDVNDILSEIPRCKIWLAHYGVDKSTYTGNYDIWQYTSSGTVDGIESEAVDLDIIYF